MACDLYNFDSGVRINQMPKQNKVI